MAEINAALLMQRVSRRLDELEARERGGGSDGGGGSSAGGIEARIGKLEAHAEHMQRDISEVKADLKALLWAGIGGFVVTWGGIIGLGLLVAKGTGMLK